MHLFGRKPQPKESILKLRSTLDIIEKREAYLQNKINNELVVAKQNMNNKRVALMALKRKKQYEQQWDKLMGAKMTIEQQVLVIENAQVNYEAMQAMKQGAQSLSNLHNNMKVEQVDQVMDDIRDQMDLANEISDAIAQPMIQMDEDELLKELEELEGTQLGEELTQISTVNAPNTQLKSALLLM
eukprot:NODE_18_length_40692_cov_0.469183.p17 type:complete len:185 gc:universal NODE_18_length_40692_cov_0.469183:12608-13162(+)